MFSSVATLLLALTALARAQMPTNVQYGLTVTFSDSNEQSTCNNDTTSDSPASAISFRTASNPASFTCFNMDETWTQPNVSYSTGGYSCLGSSICGVNYTLGGVENWYARANYSNFYYSQITTSSNFSKANGKDTAMLSFQTYAGSDCQQVQDDAIRGNATLYPWTQSNCISDGGCYSTPYEIKSFALVSSGTRTGKKGCKVGNAVGGDPGLNSGAAGLSSAVLLPMSLILGLALCL